MVRSLKVRELAVSCPCAAWLDDGFVRDAGTCTSVNGESKGKSSGKDIEDVVLSFWYVLQSFQVVRVGSAACTAFIGSFFAAVACRRAAALSGVISVICHRGSSGSCVATLSHIGAFCRDAFCRILVVPGGSCVLYQNALESGFVSPVVEGWLLQVAAALCYPNALVDVLSTPFVGFFLISGSGFWLGVGLFWTSDLVHATC